MSFDAFGAVDELKEHLKARKDVLAKLNTGHVLNLSRPQMLYAYVTGLYRGKKPKVRAILRIFDRILLV